MADEQLNRLTAALADRYRIERELGAGGMATVYLAEDLYADSLLRDGAGSTRLSMSANHNQRRNQWPRKLLR